MAQNLEIRWLRAFVTVADLGSMTDAADVLHLTQGAISQQVRKLEEQLDTRLFKRERRGLTLTRVGERVVAKARQVIALNDAIRRDAMSEEQRGRVSLGVPYDLITSRSLQLALAALSAESPEISLDLQCAPTSLLRDAVKAGELDLAILEEPAQHRTGELLYTDPLDWVVSSRTKVLVKRPLPISLIGEACVFRPLVHATLDEAGITWQSVFETDNRDVTIAAIKMDMAIGAMLRSTRPNDLVTCRVDCELPELPVFAITLTRRPDAPPVAGQLSDLLRHHLTE